MFNDVSVLQTMDLSNEIKRGLSTVLIDVSLLRLGDILGEGRYYIYPPNQNRLNKKIHLFGVYYIKP